MSEMTTKRCNSCGETKQVTEFNRVSKNSSSVRSECRECSRARMRRWRASPSGIAAIIAYKANPEKIAMAITQRISPEATARATLRHKRWLATEFGKAQAKKHGAAWRDSIDHKAWRARYRKRLYDEHSDYTCGVLMRAMLGRVLKAVGTRKTDRTHAIFGYTPEQFRLRMEVQFKQGMTWKNRPGIDGWHVDHKKPISAFLRQGVTDPKIINSLCNLQPMWARDNLAKHDSWPMIAANDNQSPVRNKVAL